jgi:adenine-specific DNA-methyltransferase
MFTKERLEELIADNRIWFGRDGNNVPRLKQFKSEIQQGMVPITIWEHEFVGHNQEAKQELKEIMHGEEVIFDSPKPTRLIRRILDIASDKDSIVLDSFAGSGVTGHAVLSLNKKDGGKRKFILVECENYANKMTAERVRRVIRGVSKAKDKNLRQDLGGSFSYFELGKPINAERILKGKNLPSFLEMARYVFYAAMGEEFDAEKINAKTGFIGKSKEYEVYLLYKPDLEYLKTTALTLERAEALGEFSGKKRLVFAPAKYLDQEHCERLHIDFAQLPFEIYRKP